MRRMVVLLIAWAAALAGRARGGMIVQMSPQGCLGRRLKRQDQVRRPEEFLRDALAAS